MMWIYIGDGANWAVARLVDGAAAGQQMPTWAPLVGLLLAMAGAGVLSALVVRAHHRRRAERSEFAVDLLAVQPWLTGEGPEEPGYRYRGRRRAQRVHRVSAHPVRPEVAATQIVPRTADDPEATAVLARPRERWGAR